MSKIPQSEKAQYIQALIDARENDDEDIFVDKALEMLTADLEKQLTIFLEDTRMTD